MKRRTFLESLGLGAALLGCGSSIRSRPVVQLPKPPPPRVGSAPEPAPHYIVFILLHGGYDSLLTFDPKLPEQVRDVDLEYRREDLLAGKQRLYGPLFRPLLPHEENLAIVHSVRVDTAAHEEATEYIARGRISHRRTDQVIGDRLGAALPGTAPIPHLVTGGNAPAYLLCGLGCNKDSNLGPHSTSALLPADQSREMLEKTRDLAPFIDAVRQARQDEAAELFDSPFHLAEYRTVNQEAVAISEILARGEVHDGISDSNAGLGLNVALEAIRMNKARFITVFTDFNRIDSHLDNLRIQKSKLSPYLDDISAFLTQLGKLRNDHGPLIDQTTVVVSSELGRFNKINNQNGRDHWPENAWLFAGRGIQRRAGGLTIGATDERRRSLPIDYASGAVSTTGKPIFVDNVFATLGRVAGLDIEELGYNDDEVLNCLIA